MSDTKTIAFVDLSSIGYPIWATSQSEPDPDTTSHRITAKVRALVGQYAHVAICCDKGPLLRKDVDPTYKANRPESQATLHHQIDLAKEELERDGFPVWSVKGYEADDLIASGAMWATSQGHNALIVSADKDLLQLVSPTVTAVSLKDGSVVDSEAVKVKFGVLPEQMRDYLSMVGDASDNVKGVKGVGAVTAAKLLEKFGTFDKVYEALAEDDDSDVKSKRFTPSTTTALKEFYPRLSTVRSLIELRTDVQLPFDDVLKPRVPKDVETFGMEDDLTEATETVATTVEPNETPLPMTQEAKQETSLVIRDAEVVPESWRLEPRSMSEAIKLSGYLHQSRLFSQYGTPQAVLAVMLAGRSFGLDAMSSLRGFHIIEGKPSMSASLMVALVLRSGLAKFFRCKTRTDDLAEWETQRVGDDKIQTLVYSLAEATAAGLVKPKSGWEKNSADMLSARASSKLARLAYADLLFGLYSPEEMDN